MKKQASDQQFHDRRHQERQRADAAKKALAKKAATVPPKAPDSPATEPPKK
jgi:hypothetical protein